MTLHQARSKFIQKVLINWSENTIQAGFCEQLEAILLPYSYSSDQKIQPNLERGNTMILIRVMRAVRLRLIIEVYAPRDV